MAFLPEIESWDEGIYQLEITDPVEGGPNGCDNFSAKGLANRTVWLKARVAEALRLSDVKAVTGNYGVVAADVGKVITIAGSDAASLTLPPLVDFAKGNPIVINIPDSYPNNVPLVSYVDDVIEDSLNSGDGVVAYQLRPGTRIVITPTDESWVVVFKTEPQIVVYGYLPGDIATSASPSLQRTGFLLCDGSVVKRTDYAALFAAIGTSYGIGDGVTTFSLPDFRGVFLRGYNGGGINDPARVFGAYQADALQDHHHDVAMAGSDNGTGTVDAGSGNAGTDPTSGATGDGVRVAAETRPKNQTVNYFIKY